MHRRSIFIILSGREVRNSLFSFARACWQSQTRESDASDGEGDIVMDFFAPAPFAAAFFRLTKTFYLGKDSPLCHAFVMPASVVGFMES